MLAKQAAKKLALTTAEDIMITEDAANDASEDEGPMPKMDLLPELQKKSGTKRNGNGSAISDNKQDAVQVGWPCHDS